MTDKMPRNRPEQTQNRPPYAADIVASGWFEGFYLFFLSLKEYISKKCIIYIWGKRADKQEKQIFRESIDYFRLVFLFLIFRLTSGCNYWRYSDGFWEEQTSKPST